MPLIVSTPLDSDCPCPPRTVWRCQAYAGISGRVGARPEDFGRRLKGLGSARKRTSECSGSPRLC
eukprot:14208937-Alexandrium_andersonii.AAC.1